MTAPTRVQLFVTCMIDAMYPEVGEAVVRILHRQGVDVHFPPGQVCCGQPAYNAGHRDEARRVARTLIAAFPGDDPIVTPSGSCAAMVKHYYPELFADDPHEKDMAQAFADRVVEFSSFLVDHLGVTDLGATFHGRATYHTSCHMARHLGVVEAPQQLLAHVKGLELVPLPAAEDCCGFGGTFAIKLPAVSVSMADWKLRCVADTQADLLVGSDMACLMHMGGRMERTGLPDGRKVRVLHVAQVLAEGLQLQ